MKELIEIQGSLEAPKNQHNSFGNYDYRSCEDILTALKPLMKKLECYLVICDEVVNIGDRYYVKATATLTNKDGKSVSNTAYARESLDKKGMDDSQITGSTSSYARKYALNGLFAIDDTKDADTMDNRKQVTRVTPKVTYEQASQGGSSAPVNAGSSPLASAKQIEFIQSLGGTPTRDMTVGQAKELISNLLAKKNG